MTDQPDRPDGDGLLQARQIVRSYFKEYDLGEPNAGAYNIIARLNDVGLLVSPPTRDGAEGTAKQAAWTPFRFVQVAFAQFKEPELRKIVDAISKQFADASPPKPAPDAMREYATRLKEIGDWLVAKENVHDAGALYSIARALSAPVPPADALRQNADRAHDKLYGFVPPADGALCPKCGITLASDETCASVGCPIQGDNPTVSPSPAVAAEPGEQIRWQRVNDEPFEYAIQHGRHGDEFVKLLNGSCLRRPVQPGAGEREAWQWLGGELKQGDPDWVAEATEPTASELSLAVFTGGLSVWTARGKQRAKVRDFIVRIDGEIFLFSEAAWLALSRQAPHSNGETGS